MSPGHDRDRFPNASPLEGPDARPPISHAGQLARGIAAALLCDTVFNVPSVLFLGRLPENFGSALASLLLGVNILAGYVGGRVATRAGLPHDDQGSQWTMSFAITVFSLMVAQFTQRVQAALHGPIAVDHAGSAPSISLFQWLVGLAAPLLLVRFGFAIGTFVQAHREGRAHDEDEAGTE